MLRQNPLNPCQLQQYNSTNEQWDVVFDLALCNPSITPSTLGTNGTLKRCNVAALLTEITFPNAMDRVLSLRDNVSSIGSLISGLVSVAASFFALFPVTEPVVIPLLGGTTVTATATTLLILDTGATRNEIDNAYWLAVKQQFFCVIPDDGILTRQILNSMANSLNNIPNKPLANELLAALIRGFSDTAAQYASAIGAAYSGNNEGCDDCSALIVGRTEYSQAISLENNRWKLKVNSRPNEYLFYRGVYDIGYNNKCYSIQIDEIINEPEFTGSPSLRLRRCGQTNDELYPIIQSLNHQCISRFEIISIQPFEFNITLNDDCNINACRLYAEVAQDYFEALSIEADNTFILSSTDRLPFGLLKRYYLNKEIGACSVVLVPFSEYIPGRLPVRVIVYDSGENETEYTTQVDIERFFNAEICFNSFALEPANGDFYLVKVRLSPCISVSSEICVVPNANNCGQLGCVSWDSLIAFDSNGAYSTAGPSGYSMAVYFNLNTIAPLSTGQTGWKVKVTYSGGTAREIYCASGVSTALGSPWCEENKQTLSPTNGQQQNIPSNRPCLVVVWQFDGGSFHVNQVCAEPY